MLRHHDIAVFTIEAESADHQADLQNLRFLASATSDQIPCSIAATWTVLTSDDGPTVLRLTATGPGIRPINADLPIDFLRQYD